jgi:hypothetical protein
MNLDILDALLCFSFQHSEGPFDVNIYNGTEFEQQNLTKDEIFKLTQDKAVTRIELAEPHTDRRWHVRQKV